MRVQLEGETDSNGFRAKARELLAAVLPPQEVHWATDAHNDDLFAEGAAAFTTPRAARAGTAASPHVPASFVALCETVALHSDPRRFDLLYKLLWRLAHEPSLRHDPLDAEMLRAHHMAKSVRHDIHKMRAFVRFREVADELAPQGATHVAWFEPEHHIVEANAPWFMRRFTNWWSLCVRKSQSWPKFIRCTIWAQPHSAARGAHLAGTQQIALVKPQALVALGAAAARSLSGRSGAVTQERGQWLQRADGSPVLVTLHPSALLRRPAELQAGAYLQFVSDLQRASVYTA